MKMGGNNVWIMNARLKNSRLHIMLVTNDGIDDWECEIGWSKP